VGITLADVKLFYPFIAEEAGDRVSQVLSGRWIGQGPLSEKLETEFARRFRYKYPVLLSSGTAGLHLALVLAGVSPGDEVITTPQTCTATNHPILQCGAKPIFGDVQYETGNLDPNAIRSLITEKTKAIMVVHWAGYPVDLDIFDEISKETGISVIQDGAHAIGATFHSQPLDRWSDYLMHSFQAIKTITTIDGGILLVGSPEKEAEAKRRRWFGIDRDHRVQCDEDGYWDHSLTEVGYKYQPNDVLAAIGLVNLKYLSALYLRRRQICEWYRGMLANVSGVALLEQKKDRKSGHWLFTIHVERRGDFRKMMTSRGIETGVIHRRNDIYEVFGGRQALPNCDRWEETNISIPLHNKLTDDEVDYVIASIRKGW